jgi:hypothetical protein
MGQRVKYLVSGCWPKLSISFCTRGLRPVRSGQAVHIENGRKGCGLFAYLVTAAVAAFVSVFQDRHFALIAPKQPAYIFLVR